MIGFTTVGTNDIQRAMAFYDALFADLNITKLIELPGLAGWGWDWDRPIFGVVLPNNDKPASPGNGGVVAFGQRTRARVLTLHERAIRMGGSNAGDPSVRGMDGSQAFFAGYVRDLDDNKLCFYCVGPGE
jgi:hypothetical protein